MSLIYIMHEVVKMNSNDLSSAIISIVKENESIEAKDIFSTVKQYGIEEVDFYSLLLELILQKKIPNILICFCGHDCSRCTTFIATLRNDNALRQQVISFYQTAFNMNLKQEDIYCLSGHSDTVMEGCKQCPWMSCAKSKNLNACSKCSEYPCKPLGEYIEIYVNKVNQIM